MSLRKPRNKQKTVEQSPLDKSVGTLLTKYMNDDVFRISVDNFFIEFNKNNNADISFMTLTDYCKKRITDKSIIAHIEQAIELLQNNSINEQYQEVGKVIELVKSKTSDVLSGELEDINKKEIFSKTIIVNHKVYFEFLPKGTKVEITIHASSLQELLDELIELSAGEQKTLLIYFHMEYMKTGDKSYTDITISDIYSDLNHLLDINFNKQKKPTSVIPSFMKGINRLKLDYMQQNIRSFAVCLGFEKLLKSSGRIKSKGYDNRLRAISYKRK